MNIKRAIFWICFIVILALIVWGLVVAMNKPAPGATVGTPAVVTSADHVLGSASSTVTVIEYSDFQCPACRTYYPLVEKLVDEASTTMRFVYRHFPLYPLPHKNAFIASQASEAASMQGKFWEMYQLLFENQLVWENSENAKTIFEGYAGQLGLNMDIYRTDFDSTEVKARVEKDRDEGEALGVNSTPTFFVNGKVIANPQGYEQFKTIIDAALTAGSN